MGYWKLTPCVINDALWKKQNSANKWKKIRSGEKTL